MCFGTNLPRIIKEKGDLQLHQSWSEITSVDFNKQIKVHLKSAEGFADKSFEATKTSCLWLTLYPLLSALCCPHDLLALHPGATGDAAPFYLEVMSL